MPQDLPHQLLSAARPGDPYLIWEVAAPQVRHAWGDGASVAWIAPSAYHGKPWLTAMGEPGAVAGLVQEALACDDGARVAGLSLPPDTFALLAPQWRPAHLEHWTWWSTRTPPDDSRDPQVVALEPGDPGLPVLLDQSASVYLRPGDVRARQWFGLVESDALLACLAYEHHHPAVPHLASVVVDASHRGRGYGSRLCRTVTGALLAQGAPAVSLAMMTANRAAAALYAGIGFEPAGSFASGTIPGRRDYPAVPGWRPGGAS